MKTISNFKFQISNFKSQACLLLTAHCLLLTPAVHAEIIDRIVAVVNDSAITMSELNAATAGLGDIKGADKDKRKKIMETKSKVLDQLIEKKLVEQAANKAGITVSEKEIDNSIDDVKRQNNIGQEELLSALAKNGLTFKEYREQLKDQIRQVKFINKEIRSNIKMSDEDGKRCACNGPKRRRICETGKGVFPGTKCARWRRPRLCQSRRNG
ncbi:MAG: SurA N-terminal domain-containing protein [Deltaproteobacteria bacterium]|nr:SurA N-terminal domain-containing protein [Deltaproteobacteria bacterium]